eukprot:7134232-Ditylum_brightwellii.AAC.1
MSEGQEAWKVLVNHYEGPAFKVNQHEKVMNTLTMLEYVGEKKGFNFARYLRLHLEAHHELLEIREPIEEPTKITFFKCGIQEQAGLVVPMETA